MAVWDWPTCFLFLCTLAFAFICLRQYDLLREKANVFYLVVALIPCFCLFGFRHPDVGRDLATYSVGLLNAKYGAEHFFFYSSGNLASEPLSNIIMYVSFWLGGIQPFIFLTSLVQFIFVFIFLRRFHIKGFNVAFLFLIYFSVIQLRSCSMVRNGIALSASFCAYSCFLNESKNHKLYWLFTLLAVGFHNSAIINIPIYFMCKPMLGNGWEVYRNVILKVMSILFVVGLIYLMKIGFMNDVITSVSDGKYANYEMSSGSGLGNIIVRLPLLFLFSFYIREMKKNYGLGIVCFFYLLFFDLLIAQSRYIYKDLERLTQYSVFGEMFLISLFYDFIRERVSFPFQIIYFLIFILFFAYYMYRWAVMGQYGLMPFKFMDFSFGLF